ncbi:MAG: iron ABC transporter substrate-binding protein [Desulfococcaceae bacterium]
MRNHFIKIFLPILILAAAVPAAGERQITDQVGRTVAVPENPERIVCIGPGALRLVVYLQARDRVAGIEELEKRHPYGRPYFLAHPELGELPRIGPGGPASINRKPDLEAVLSVRPDLIFVTYMEKELADEVQASLNVPVVVLSYGDFAAFDETVYDALRLAGSILNRSERAEAVIEFIETARSDLTERTRDIPPARRPSVYVGGVGFRGTQGIESTHADYTPLNWIHARNLALGGGHQGHRFVDRETLLAWNPAVIFIDGGGKHHVTADAGRKPDFYRTLQAAKNSRVYTLFPFNWYVVNIGTAIADAYAAGKILQPEQFEDVDPVGKADEIYAFLVGRPVYAKMRDQYGELGARLPLPPEE